MLKEALLTNKKENNKATRIIAMVLLCFIVIVILYLTVFDAASIRHTCSGADCPICHEIHVAKLITKQLSLTSITAGFRFLLVMFAIIAIIYHSDACIRRNLVIDKVRLDH